MGRVLDALLILMAVMSTGSAEIIAVASIVIYDVYQTYICPFRRDHKDGQCILCGRYLRQQKGEDVTEVCSCPSAEGCEACNEDTLARAETLNVVKPHYTCQAHGAYKEYQEHLLNYKNWCIVLCTFLSIPLCRHPQAAEEEREGGTDGGPESERGVDAGHAAEELQQRLKTDHQVRLGIQDHQQAPHLTNTPSLSNSSSSSSITSSADSKSSSTSSLVNA